MSIGRNTIANVIGAVVPSLVTLLTVPTYLKLIGEERYGALAVLWVLLGYFGFFDLGLGRATARQMALLNNRSAAYRGNLLWTTIQLTTLLGLIGGVVLWLSADFIFAKWVTLNEQSAKEALGALPWLVVGLPLVLLTSALSGALEGRESFWELNKVGILGNVLNQIFPLLAAAFGFVGLNILVPAALCGRVVSGVLLYIYCKKSVPFIISESTFEKSFVKPLLNYGGWTSLISVIDPLLITIDRLVIGSISGAKAVAYYTVPFSLSFNANKLSGSLLTAIFPRLAAAEPAEGVMLANHATQILTAVMTPLIIVGVSVFKPFLVLWLGGDLAAKASGVGEMILCGIWIHNLAIPHHARLRAQAMLKRVFFISLIQVPIYLYLLIYSLKLFGIVGAAGVWALRMALDTVMILWAAGVVITVIKNNYLSFFLMFGALLFSFILNYHDPYYWIVAFLLLLISLFHVKDSLNLIIKSLFIRTVRVV